MRINQLFFTLIPIPLEFVTRTEKSKKLEFWPILTREKNIRGGISIPLGFNFSFDLAFPSRQIHSAVNWSLMHLMENRFT